MRKLKLQMQLSIDGFVAGPNGEMDWMVWNWDTALAEYVKNITDPVDCIILGRVLAQGFIDHWATAASSEGPANDEFAHKMTDTHKVVFTKTLESSDWTNTVLAKGNLTDEINELKQQRGGDIIAYGGGSFVSDLIKHNLIDEYHLFFNPAAIGKGMTIFSNLDTKFELNLIKATGFDCGIVVMMYTPKNINHLLNLIEP